VKSRFKARLGVGRDELLARKAAGGGLFAWIAKARGLGSGSGVDEAARVTGVEQRGILSGVGSESFAFESVEVECVDRDPPIGVSVGKVEKVLCDSCGFRVNPFGHANRCKKRETKRLVSGWDNQRVKAWLNDTVLRYDVQIRLVASDIPPSRWNKVLDSLVSGEAQAAYWASVVDRSDLPVPSGTSAHSVSTAFECSYTGEFRQKFLEHVQRELDSME